MNKRCISLFGGVEQSLAAQDRLFGPARNVTPVKGDRIRRCGIDHQIHTRNHWQSILPHGDAHLCACQIGPRFVAAPGGGDAISGLGQAPRNGRADMACPAQNKRGGAGRITNRAKPPPRGSGQGSARCC